MNKSEQALYNYLVEYVTDDETAKLFVDGGEGGYYYGGGGYVSVDRDDKELMNELMNDDNRFLIDDVSLDDAYLIGSLP